MQLPTLSTQNVQPSIQQEAPSLDQQIDAFVAPVSAALNEIIFFSVSFFGVRLPLVVVWLIGAAAIFTIAFRFINLRGFAHAWSVLLGRGGSSAHDTDDGKDVDGEISHFEALSSALSGTVGLGNIASVPVAICLGGPGAIFWMILAGFLGMSSKFAECALAVKYRRVLPSGRVLGGPMFYIEAVFRRRNLSIVGKGLAIVFAVACMGGSISIFQVNQSHAQFESVTGVSAPLTYGVILCGLVAFVILGGIKSIGRVTRILVPGMAGIYLLAGISIIIINIGELPGAIGLIFSGAFGLDAAGGGIAGALINGVQRATYSSEAGVGSAAIAHSAVKTKDPLSEGFVALLEPFIDTIVVCTITALVIIVTGVYEPFLYVDRSEIVGIGLTSAAFADTFSWYPYVLLVSVVLFAFSTLVSWAYYGSQAAAYLFGATRSVDVTFKIVLCLLLSTGAAVSLSAIIDFIDAMLFTMCVPNIIALYLLLPELRRDLSSYEERKMSNRAKG
ncbi:MAG: alanine/glycine:cation symporter family protein [Pseudomonadota bacterium]